MKARVFKRKRFKKDTMIPLYQISLSSLSLSQVIGSVTTYLVILIQVGDLPNGNSTMPNSSITNFTLLDFTTLTTDV